jgi:circadian clock protein KaiB
MARLMIRAKTKTEARTKAEGKTKTKSEKVSLLLRLYVAGNAPNSRRAFANATAICDEYLTSRYELEVVDLLKYPRRALADGIIVTPTLLRLRPLPIQRVIGNLCDTNQVMLTLATK